MAHEGEAPLRDPVQGGHRPTACIAYSAVLSGIWHVQPLWLAEEVHHLLLVAALLLGSFLLHRIMSTNSQGVVAAASNLHNKAKALHQQRNYPSYHSGSTV